MRHVMQQAWLVAVVRDAAHQVARGSGKPQRLPITAQEAHDARSHAG